MIFPTTLITSPVSHTVYDILQWSATVIFNQQSTAHFFQLFAFALWKVFSMFLLYTICSKNYFCSSWFTIVSLKVCIKVVPHSAQSLTQANVLTRTSANFNNYKSV